MDNTQAFYAKPIPSIDTLYTCRKFFGVPDGAYLYCDEVLDEDIEQEYSYDKMAHLLKRIDLSAEEGYADFRRVDDGLDNQPIRKMSKLTQRMMQAIDYESAALRRRANYELLQNALGKKNNLEVPLEDDAVPLVYPYFVSSTDLREKLINNKIFVARYWPNVMEWSARNDIEYMFAVMMQPLPIDQRYGEKEIEYIIRQIKR